MGKFMDVFDSVVKFSYHAFDRMVLNAYLPLARSPNIVYFFREVKREPIITKELLRKRTHQYMTWVKAYACKQEIQLDWAASGVRKKDALENLRKRKLREGTFGTYAIIKSMEQGPSFRINKPKYEPSNDPNWMLILPQFSRYTHLYFYIIDEVLGPFSMRVGTFFPFNTTYYLNGHNIIQRTLDAQNIGYRMRENAFIAVDDPNALQRASDAISPAIIEERLNRWTLAVAPKFSANERNQMNLERKYYMGQIEYAQNFIFKRSAKLHSIFERSCDLGLARSTPKYLSEVFGWRITKRTQGKLQTVIDQIDFGHHVLRSYSKNTYVKQYQKYNTFLRNETCSNNVTDFKDIRKSIKYMPELAKELQAVNSRFSDQQAENLNVEPDHPLLEKLAKPVKIKTQRFAGIRLDQDRMIRLLELLAAGKTQINGSTTAELHQDICKAYELKEKAYTKNQLSYDLRKLKAHGLIERVKGRFAYRLTEKGRKTAALMVLLRNRIVRPLAGSLFERPVKENIKPPSKLHAQYRKAKKEINLLIQMMKAS